VLKRIDFGRLKSTYRRETLREVQLLMRLHNPLVVRYFNSFVEDEGLHIVMEHAERGDLHKLMRQLRERKETLSEDMVWLFAFQMCLGVGFLHYQKVIHRDIKCMNVLLGSDNVVKIGDLGVSKVHQTSLSKELPETPSLVDARAGRVGTPLYLSPEVVR